MVPPALGGDTFRSVADATAPTSRTYSVAELAETIGERVRAAFPAEVWVTGEIQNLTDTRSVNRYFSLVDAEDGHDAQLSVVLLSRDRERVNRLLKKSGMRVRMTNGTEVRIRGRIDWYAPRGQLQLRMVSIDPAFTLGQLAVARAALLEKLAAEGLLGRNRTVPMPLLPLRVGLVTSAGSAAEADVLHELDASGFAFDVQVADVRVQGADAPGSVAGAIRWFAQRSIDVVVVARGGGAATDLAAFDQELVARAIAESPHPVVTGVGHEIDRTVADEVAHLSAKTPTAAAQQLVAVVAESARRAYSTFEAILAVVDDTLRHRAERLERLATRASTAAVAATRAELHRVEDVERRMGRAANARLGSASSAADAASRRLRSAGRRRLDEAARSLHLLASRTAAVDPERALARGWSITRLADGTVLRSAADAPAGTAIHTTLADGSIASTVTTDPEDP